MSWIYFYAIFLQETAEAFSKTLYRKMIHCLLLWTHIFWKCIRYCDEYRITYDFRNRKHFFAGMPPDFPPVWLSSTLLWFSMSEGLQVFFGVLVALSSPNFTAFSLKVVKWVTHPMFFPFPKCQFFPESACFCSLSSAFRLPIFSFV